MKRKTVCALLVSTLSFLALSGCSSLPFSSNSLPSDDSLPYKGHYLSQKYEAEDSTNITFHEGAANPVNIASNTYYYALELVPSASAGASVSFSLDDSSFTPTKICFTAGLLDSYRQDSDFTNDSCCNLKIEGDGETLWEKQFFAYSKPDYNLVKINGVSKLTFSCSEGEFPHFAFGDLTIYEASDAPKEPTVSALTGSNDFLKNLAPFYKSQGDYVSSLDGTSSDSFQVGGTTYKEGILFDWEKYSSNVSKPAYVFYNLKGQSKYVNLIFKPLDGNENKSLLFKIHLDNNVIYEKTVKGTDPEVRLSFNTEKGYLLGFSLEKIVNADSFNSLALYSLSLGDAHSYEIDTSKVDYGTAVRLISGFTLPYSVNSAKVYSDKSHYIGQKTFGVAQTEGILLIPSNNILGTVDSSAYFNLRGRMKNLSFNLSRHDKSWFGDNSLEVILDDKVKYTFEGHALSAPERHEVNVEGVKSLGFRMKGLETLYNTRYFLSELVVYPGEIVSNYCFKDNDRVTSFPDNADIFSVDQPYDYLCSPYNGHDSELLTNNRYFDGICDGTSKGNWLKVKGDSEKHYTGFTLATNVYISVDYQGIQAAGLLGVGLTGYGLILLLIASSSELHEASLAFFNLRGQYKSMSFKVGRIDGETDTGAGSSALFVLGDEGPLHENPISLSKSMAPTTYTINLKNTSRLIFWLRCNLDEDRSAYYGVYDIVVSK